MILDITIIQTISGKYYKKQIKEVQIIMEDTILCPDCQLEVITQKQYEKHQRCTKCSKRKYQIERRGDTYIPFINLSKKEQKQILETLKDEIQAKVYRR